MNKACMEELCSIRRLYKEPILTSCQYRLLESSYIILVMEAEKGGRRINHPHATVYSYVST